MGQPKHVYTAEPVTRTLKGNEKQFEVIGVNFSEIVIKVKEIYFELAGNSSYPSPSYRGSNIFRRPVH